jgi:hypothetical protein
VTKAVAKDNLPGVLESYIGSTTPGLQYVVVDAEETRFAYAGAGLTSPISGR